MEFYVMRILDASQARHFYGLDLFWQMQRAKVKPDAIVIANVLSACTHLVPLF